jgi:hypothetical protein
LPQTSGSRCEQIYCLGSLAGNHLVVDAPPLQAGLLAAELLLLHRLLEHPRPAGSIIYSRLWLSNPPR